MNLNSLIRQAVPPEGASEKLQADYADFLERINDHSKFRENVARFRREFQQLLDNPDAPAPEGSSGSIEFAGQVLRDMELQLVTGELTIRVDLESFLGRVTTANSAASRAAGETLTAVKTRIVKYLVDGGWHDPKVHPLSPSRVLPGMVNDHPDCREADATAKRLFDVSSRQLVRLNREALVQLRQQVRDSGKRLASIGT